MFTIAFAHNADTVPAHFLIGNRLLRGLGNFAVTPRLFERGAQAALFRVRQFAVRGQPNWGLPLRRFAAQFAFFPFEKPYRSAQLFFLFFSPLLLQAPSLSPFYVAAPKRRRNFQSGTVGF